HLFIANETGTVGEYDATSGATINASFISSSQGLAGPTALALDGNNHLFVVNFGLGGSVGEYNATTGATINAALINNTQGLTNAADLIFVAAVPEPSSLLLLVVAAGVCIVRRPWFVRQSTASSG